MVDQIVIGSTASHDVYGASVALRTISQPAKKEIKETIPFSNVTYDFSGINGELYWEERTLEYTFEMLATSPEELENMKTAFSGWVMNICSEKLFDPFISDYHFLATFDDLDFDDDEGQEKTTAKVKFSAYPYKIANVAKEYAQSIAAGKTVTVAVVNNSAHRLTPTITADGAVSLTLGNTIYSVSAGTYTDDAIKIAVGENLFSVKNTGSAAADVTISFYEEVF